MATARVLDFDNPEIIIPGTGALDISVYPAFVGAHALQGEIGETPAAIKGQAWPEGKGRSIHPCDFHKKIPALAITLLDDECRCAAQCGAANKARHDQVGWQAH